MVMVTHDVYDATAVLKEEESTFYSAGTPGTQIFTRPTQQPAHGANRSRPPPLDLRRADPCAPPLIRPC
jgi:hypothetical protein